jgi:hypothetical protein
VADVGDPHRRRRTSTTLSHTVRHTLASLQLSALDETHLLRAADFGAVADDALDDTDALQAAIDAARERPGSVVQLGEGTYRVSERPPLDWNALRVHAARGLTLRGAGAERTELVFASERDGHVLALTDCTDVTVQGLSIDGRRHEHRLGHGLRVANSSGITLRELSIEHAAHYGIGLQRGALRHVNIEQVRIHDTGSDAIDFNNEWSQNQALLVRGVSISKPAQVEPNQSGIDVRGPVEITDVSITEVPAGSVGIRLRGDSQSSGRGAHGARISDFHVSGAPSSVGLGVDATGVLIEHGSIAGAVKGLRLRVPDTVIEDVELLP